MRRFLRYAMPLALSAVIGFAGNSYAVRGDHSRPSGGISSTKKQGLKSRTKSKNKPFKSLIKDRVVVEGLFTFYHDTTDNSWLMAIKPEQLHRVYLCGISVVQGDGAFIEGNRMFNTIPCYFSRVANNIMMLEKNVRYTADSSYAIANAVRAGISDGLIATAEIKSLPDDSTGAVLIDPSPFFVRDVLNLGYLLGQMAKTGFSYDGKNSSFDRIKSFPQNSEIAVQIRYSTKKPSSFTSLQNPHSFFHVYNFSLSTLPESDYVPRYADDRIGNFLSLHQDYTQLDKETPYVRYIERWNLKKKNPTARVSSPVEPIVYWLENTIPDEYRDAISAGVEFWNQSFEKIGFRQAIIARQMPDDAEWDPADIRYSTIRWLVASDAPYVAIGPSRANPLTGQIYDADIGIVADAIRWNLNRAEYRVAPLTFDSRYKVEPEPWREELLKSLGQHARSCELAKGMAENGAFANAYFTTTVTDPVALDSVKKAFVKAFLIFTVAHEVGHTLGFRHNFKASAIHSMEQVNDPEFTREHGMVGTVMDYPSANLASPGQPQGEYYPATAGAYDDWVIEYSYSDFGAASPDDEKEELEKIASKSPGKGLYYATDEDTFGISAKAIDPRNAIWDLSDDPIAFVERNIEITQEIWKNAIKKFEQPGTRYQKIRNVFQSGWSPYILGAFNIPKYIGGIYYNRNHIGDALGTLPFTVVPASEQRRAVAFLRDKIFSAESFNLPAELINKLENENLEDFHFSAYYVAQVDYPVHQQVLRIQNTALYQIYSPYVLGRLLNNLSRVKPGVDRYTMFDLFTDIRRAIWTEITGNQAVNSFRRQLQLSHLNMITNIYLGGPTRYPLDARTLAANDLTILKEAARQAINRSGLDTMSRLHYKEVVRQIESAQKARRYYSSR